MEDDTDRPGRLPFPFRRLDTNVNALINILTVIHI